MFEGLLGHDKTVIRGGFRMAYDPEFYNIFLNAATAAPAVHRRNLRLRRPACPLGITGAQVQAHWGGSSPSALTPEAAPPPGSAPISRILMLKSGRSVFSGRSAASWPRKSAMWAPTPSTNSRRSTATRSCAPQIQEAFVREACLAGSPSLVPAGVTPCATPDSGIRTRLCQLQLHPASGCARTEYRPLQLIAEPAEVPELARVYGGGGIHLEQERWTMRATSISAYGPSAVAGPQNPFCTGACERGLSALDYPHNFTLYWHYELPFGDGQTGVLARLLGGWASAVTTDTLVARCGHPSRTR